MIKPLSLAALLAVSTVFLPLAGRADDPVSLTRALAAAARTDWDQAAAEARLAGPLAFDLIEWQRLRAGKGSFADYADFAARRGDWPGMELLRKQGEAQLAGANPVEIVAYFGDGAPQTGTGALALIAARQAMGQPDKAAAVAEAAWRRLELTAEEQAAFLARHADLVAPFHGGRMQAALDQGRLARARAMLPLVTPGTKAVAAARIALQARTEGVDKLLQAVPERLAGSAGLARDRAVWRWRNSLEDGAAEIVLAFSKDAESLGDPKLWAEVRGQLARFFLRQGDPRLAYKIAARHRLPSDDADWGDLEWLAGFAALKLGDAPTALEHFEALEAGVSTPISKSRAAYWRGRALEVIGRVAEADQAWVEGAQWQTAYYGLLCAERIGAPLDPAFATPPALPDWKAAPFVSDPVFQAAQLLQAAGARDLAERFLLHLEERLPPEQIAPLARLAEEWHNAHLMLLLAKRAANEGVVLTRAYYPLPELNPAGLVVPEELALSIARRESEFDPAVISPVGARGMMQLMPETAKMMAKKLGEPYELRRLTSDPSYNVRLGSEYLAKLQEEFGTSPVLVAAGYNAGPGRPRRWISERGDPRQPAVDVVEWVEMIPFTETRTYVMRVAESLPVYRARLGRPDAGAVRFTDELRGNW
ncbi:lytic transglycosylase domain-containing protein [Rhodobacter capsulatus]|uniref:lytic transglycosylase domain-containing protein n=1 Tax=Rhodobacter capsulatus TaxID=1061 RepID=UPI0003D2DF97|nr:lytic transglycosylase domain-containing protein [Rhodobacter capsulatus]ETD88287.1 lytic transglycosylase [Rhodobacter capsulatus YW2]